MKCKVRINCVGIELEILPLPGDPLYVGGGQPKCFDPEIIDENFAKDGYANVLSTTSIFFLFFRHIFSY